MSPSTGEEDNTSGNPLLKDFQFPPYDAIRADHICPGIRTLLTQLEREFEDLERALVVKLEHTWQEFVEPLEKIIDRLDLVWGAIDHLQMVKNTPELTAAIEETQPAVVAFRLKLDGSKPVFNGFRAIRDSPTTWDSLTNSQRKLVELRLWGGVVGGIALEGHERERFIAIEQELKNLSDKFMGNMLNSTKKFEKLITDKKDIEGLSATALGLAAQTAVLKGHKNATAEKGPWIFTLDDQSYNSVIGHARNRNLREELYRAYMTRASSGDFDNKLIIDRILSLRFEKANLLGYRSYAELRMEKKMATVDKALELLEQLRMVAWDVTIQEMEDLKQFARSHGAQEADNLEQFDILFWAERFWESRFEMHEEHIRPYFSFPQVMDGLFELANRLFAIKIEAADGLVPVWDRDVKFYHVNDSSGSAIAFFYFDPYSRPSEKQQGAWTIPIVFRSRVMSPDGITPRLPVVYMGSNLMPPMDKKPSLLTFEEVKIVFHEFGHALQHMLAIEDEGLVSSLRGLEHDAWELPSQFMENWCYQRDTLMSIAKHYESGQIITEHMYQKLLTARTFRAGTRSLNKLGLSTLDLELHTNYRPGGAESAIDVERRIVKKYKVFPSLPDTRHLCVFFHIFVGGYEAGYYGYEWAEVFSSDAFAKFEEVGLDNEKAMQETGRRFREIILGLGGGRTALQVFVEFRGREPSLEALIRNKGLFAKSRCMS